ncbi:hypothetical protein B296_00014856 [Ensete ventricosum]|uniref:Uncharacterized protein n=1 Tax=Ensete ventricosum TaxID=4639 RepID=A0A426ZU99_ENSVE|nr:hypothetical protein B296_00014856 [Ensete ventricosum]
MTKIIWNRPGVSNGGELGDLGLIQRGAERGRRGITAVPTFSPRSRFLSRRRQRRSVGVRSLPKLRKKRRRGGRRVKTRTIRVWERDCGNGKGGSLEYPEQSPSHLQSRRGERDRDERDEQGK